MKDFTFWGTWLLCWCKQKLLSCFVYLDLYTCSRIFHEGVWEVLEWKILPFGELDCCAGVEKLLFWFVYWDFSECMCTAARIFIKGVWEVLKWLFLKEFTFLESNHNWCRNFFLSWFVYIEISEVYLVSGVRFFTRGFGKSWNDFSWKILPFRNVIIAGLKFFLKISKIYLFMWFFRIFSKCVTFLERFYL